MINKKMMSYIKKELKNGNDLTIRYLPTEEEKLYLLKYNINCEIVTYNYTFLSGKYFELEYCRYYV